MTQTDKSETCVFTIERDVWRAVLHGRLLPAEWNSRGAALAGLQVEARRLDERTAKPQPTE